MEFFRLLGLQLEKILIVGFYASVSLWLKFLEEKLDTIVYEGVVWSLCRKTCADLRPIPGFPLTLVRTSCQAAECEGKRMLWCELQHIFITLPPTGKSPVPWKHLQALTLPHDLISCSSTTILPKMGHTVLLNGLQTHTPCFRMDCCHYSYHLPYLICPSSILQPNGLLFMLQNPANIALL